MIDYNPKQIMEWTRKGMRKSFGDIMSKIVEDNKDIVVLAADVSSSAGLNEFAKTYQNNFYNVGIAETNMIGVAAGLAKEGNNVFVTTFAPFASMRPYEAIRTLVGYMHLNVKIVALGSGVSLGPQGNTHYCIEDFSLMKTIPGIKIFSPSDCCEMAKVLEYLSAYDGPAYVRLSGIDGSAGVHKDNFDYNVEGIENIRDGNDIAIFATGSIVSEAVRASRALTKEGLSCAVYNVSTIKPISGETIVKLCNNYKCIFSLEEHNVIGGLGSSIADALVENGACVKLHKIGFNDVFPHVGDYSYVLDQYGLNAAKIKDTIINYWKENQCE